MRTKDKTFEFKIPVHGLEGAEIMTTQGLLTSLEVHGYRFVVHQEGVDWVVSEFEYGCAVGWGTSKNKAIKDASITLNRKSAEQFKYAIDKFKSNTGISSPLNKQ